MIVALDFDGVIMDGINECMLVAWNVFNNKPLSNFNRNSLNEIPKEFVSKFTYLRNFVRHDGHFIVPFYTNGNSIIDSQSFNQVYDEVSDASKLKFIDNFLFYRRKAKEMFPEYWISLHKELIDLKEIINLGVDVRIISGKDSESILFLLKKKGIYIDTGKTHGRIIKKEIVLSSIKAESIQTGEYLVFIDDNLNNVIDARKLGIESLWAIWGFHTSDDRNEAKRLSIKTIDKQLLINFIQKLKENEEKYNDNKKAKSSTCYHIS